MHRGRVRPPARSLAAAPWSELREQARHRRTDRNRLRFPLRGMAWLRASSTYLEELARSIRIGYEPGRAAVGIAPQARAGHRWTLRVHHRVRRSGAARPEPIGRAHV